MALLIAAVVAQCGLSAPVKAACPGTIVSGEIQTTTQTLAAGENCTVQAGGAISTATAGERGIANTGNGVTVSNAGSIITTGNASDGILAGDGNAINNSGQIATTGNNAFGIYAVNGNTIFNSGTISTSGDNTGGIFIAVGSGTTIVNSGSVISTGVNSVGVQTFENTTLINSGLISATQGRAINFIRGTNELVLRPGSRIIGEIELGTGSDTIAFQNRVGTVLTFVNDGNGVPEAINTGGRPFVINGTTVAVLDPSGFTRYDEQLSDLTSGIFNSVHARLSGIGSTAQSHGDSGMKLGLSDSGLRLGLGGVPAASGPGAGETSKALWAQAFGGLRHQRDDGLTNGADHALGGFVAGLDGSPTRNTRLGAFAGFAHGKLDVNSDSQTIETDSYFAGLYGSVRIGGGFARVILTAGQTTYDSSRSVYYNLAPTGIQTAKASYDGTFVSPEIALGTTWSLGGLAVEPSMRARYAFVSLDSYRETGAIDSLSVAGRDVSLWQGRAQLAFPMTVGLFQGGTATFAPRVGVEGRVSHSGNVSANFFGQAISFDPGGKNNEVTGFIGATASTTIAHNINLFADGEVHAGDAGVSRSEARVGLKVNF